MHEPESAQNNRMQAKTALAIGLTVIFGAVVVAQIRTYWPGTEATASAKSNRAATDSIDLGRSQLAGPNRIVADDEEPDGKWPTVLLSECTQYDPFATPDGFVLKNKKSVQPKANGEVLQTEIEIERKRAAQDQVISSLRDAGVNAILWGPKQSTAIVGTRMVRVGEEVEGFRVLAIEPDGIVIERPAVR